MKSCLVFVLVVVLALAEAARIRREEEKYPSKYDNIDLDEILNSDRLLDNYYKCLTDKGKCTPEGTELKKHIGDALQNECERCTEKQKEGAKKVIKFLVNNKPDMWKAVQELYDPENKYYEKHREELQGSSA